MARRDDDDRLGSARDEAERLIAAALAAASFASRQAARRSRERDRGRRDDSLGDDLAGLAGAATRLVGEWFGPDRGRDRRRGNDRYDDRFDGYDRRDADRRGDGDARTTSTHHIANGSDACCSCPVCRTIDFVREPSPEFVERLATGASDLASGVTSVLRAFGDVTGVGRRDPRRRATRADVIDDFPAHYPTGPTTTDPLAPEPTTPEPTMSEPTLGEPVPPADEADDLPGASEPAHTVPPTPPAGRRFGGRLGGDFSSVWQAATRAPMSDPARRAPQTPKPMAKKAVKAPGGVPSEPPPPDSSDETGRPAKAARTKSVPTKSQPTKSQPTKSAPTQSVPPKAAPTRGVTAKATASKTAATKAGATKAAAKKAGAKTTATKAGATKATATKASAKKASAAKATATKASAKNASAKNASAAKATATKATATKASAKKTTAAKAAATKKATPATPRTTRQPRG